jgi:hypothetical protein
MPTDRAAPPSNPASPSHAERARTLAHRARWGALSTLARDPAGYPYGSLVATVVDPADGAALLCISRLAEHTQNLLARPEASLLLHERPTDDRSPLALGRLTLLGPCQPVPAASLEAARELYIAAHPDAAQYASFGDFGFYRLAPVSLRFVAGFGRMSWIDAEAYRAAAPDPLADAAPGILAHMNDDHAEALLTYARVLAGIADAEAARMTAVDRLGFEMEVKTPAAPRFARLAFDAEVRTSDEVRKALVAMVKAARAAR